MKQSTVILVALFFISTVSVIHCKDDRPSDCSLNFELCEENSECCSNNCLTFSVPPICYHDPKETNELIQARMRRDVCSYHNDSALLNELSPEADPYDPLVVFYNYFPDNTRILLTINGKTQTVVNANINHLTKKNHTSSVMKLTPTTAKSFGIKFEGSVPCHFVVVDPKIAQDKNSSRVFFGFLLLGICLTMTGVAIFLQ